MGQHHSSTLDQRVGWVSELLTHRGQYGVVSQQEETHWRLAPNPLHLESQRASGPDPGQGTNSGTDQSVGASDRDAAALGPCQLDKVQIGPILLDSSCVVHAQTVKYL